MLFKLPIVWIVALNIGGWLVIQLGLAWLFVRLPDEWFTVREQSTKPRRRFFYEHVLRIKLWKDRLPDGARWFEGGFAKRKLAGTNPAYFRRFIQEALRGEICHWLAIACAPVFFLWNPAWGGWVNLIYALAANLPCVLAQRYNRARLQRLLRPRAADHRPFDAPEANA